MIMLDFAVSVLAMRRTLRDAAPVARAVPTIGYDTFVDIEGQVMAARRELEARRRRRRDMEASSRRPATAVGPQEGEDQPESGISSRQNYQVLGSIVDKNHDPSPCEARRRQSPHGVQLCTQCQSFGEI
jgi:hypothetical protein